ncbi:MAG: hypothetical protein H0W73_00390 [Bacteroidetes bacterium]|nr:hypothetical protein [Bacteroidota bacterium]
MKKLLPIFIFSFVLSSCVKDKPQNTIQPQVQLTNAKKVYVINEGVFPNGNAEVSLFDTGNDAVIEKFYANQNSNAALGDVAQSMNYFNNRFYIVVNNSHKIIVCDQDFKKIGQITSLSSPRYILPVTNQKAYVSDLYANAINIIDLNTNTKTGSIPCPGWTEEMVLIYNKVFVTNVRKDYVYIINTINDTKIDSINAGLNAGSIVIDKNDKVWILSTGDNQNSISGKLTRINAVTNQVETSFTFGSTESPGTLKLNKTKDTLYFLKGGIYRMAITDANLPASEFISKGTKNFYGLGINPNDHTIYAADALDFNSRSNIYIYNSNGSAKKNFKAGLNSNGFYFE